MKRARGFTLIELIIATVVLGIMAAALAPMALSSLRAYRETIDDVAVLDKLRYATERLAREIREVNAIKASGKFTNFNFTSMGTNSVVFTRTYFSDSGSESANTVVVICGNNGTNLTLSYNSLTPSCPDTSGIVLTNDLSTLTLSYFDQAGILIPTASLPDSSNVRSVNITLTLTNNSLPSLPYTQQTRVELKRYSGP